MNKYYYTFIILSKKDVIVYDGSGIIICKDKSELIEKAKLIYESYMESAYYTSDFPIKDVHESIKTFNFGKNLYKLKFEIINLDYTNRFNIQSKYYNIVTEKYKAWVGYNDDIFLDKYLVLDNSEDIRFEDSDIDADSGTKFNVGDHVRFIKDPFKSTFIVKGKVGPNRHIDDCDCCNYYSIEKDDGTKYFDNAHESELVKI